MDVLVLEPQDVIVKAIVVISKTYGMADVTANIKTLQLIRMDAIIVTKHAFKVAMVLEFLNVVIKNVRTDV